MFSGFFGVIGDRIFKENGVFVDSSNPVIFTRSFSSKLKSESGIDVETS